MLAADALLPADLTFGAVPACLLLAATGVAAPTRMTHDDGRRHTRAVPGPARATAQLGAVPLLIGWVIGAVPTLLGFVFLMYAVAVRTAGLRITADRTSWWAAAPLGARVGPVLAVVLLTGLLPLKASRWCRSRASASAAR